MKRKINNGIKMFYLKHPELKGKKYKAQKRLKPIDYMFGYNESSQ